MFKIRLIKKLAVLFAISLFMVSALLVYVGLRDNYKENRHQRLMARAIIKPVRVFQIGFSKCGTSTIASFFARNYIRTVHHDKGILASSMYYNHLNNKPIIGPKFQHYSVFTDMENMYMDPALNIGMLMFKDLDKQYPGSKFILNVRDKNAWLKSRSLHPLNNQIKTTILDLNAEIQKITKEQVLEKWSHEWDLHIAAVLDYFKDRPEDLLVFNIEQDPPENLVNFLKEYFVLDPKLYKHINKTSERDMLIANRSRRQAEAQKKFSLGWLTRLIKDLS